MFFCYSTIYPSPTFAWSQASLVKCWICKLNNFALVGKILKESGAKVVNSKDPCELPKACKNTTEISGFHSAHKRDGLALTRFLYWLSKEAPKGKLTEITAAAKLESLRKKDKYYRGPSFPTISGSGENGAIIHYRATNTSDKKLKLNSLYFNFSPNSLFPYTAKFIDTFGPPAPPSKKYVE